MTLSEPYDPDAPLRERVIARGSAVAVLVAMVMLWARLIWLWTSGTIKTEPFFGSTAWNLAIVLPAVVTLTIVWLIRRSRERRREQQIAAIMPIEPLAGWHGRIKSFDAKLARGTPTRNVDTQIWQLTLEIVDAYPTLDATQRDHVRILWRTYENFGIYASAEERRDDDDQSPEKPLTTENVRRELLLHSIRDQFPDARDAVVDLGDLRARALAAGIDFATLAREAAELADDTNRDPMFGSTRDLILRYA